MELFLYRFRSWNWPVSVVNLHPRCLLLFLFDTRGSFTPLPRGDKGQHGRLLSGHCSHSDASEPLLRAALKREYDSTPPPHPPPPTWLLYFHCVKKQKAESGLPLCAHWNSAAGIWLPLTLMGNEVAGLIAYWQEASSGGGGGGGAKGLYNTENKAKKESWEKIPTGDKQ